MPALSCIVTCKGRLEHLKQSLPRLARWADTQVVVVDYDCPDAAGAWVASAFPGARIVAETNAPLFNLARARNLGAAASDAPWLLFLDADTLVGDALRNALATLMTPGSFAVAKPRSGQSSGALLLSRDDHAAVGGYDEALQGWGSEDEDMIARLLLAGRGQRTFDAALLDSIPHDHDLRTAHYAVKDAMANNRVNFTYRMVKHDLARLGATLSLQQRRSLYADVGKACAGGQTMEIAFRDVALGDGRLISHLRYELSDPAAT